MKVLNDLSIFIGAISILVTFIVLAAVIEFLPVILIGVAIWLILR